MEPAVSHLVTVTRGGSHANVVYIMKVVVVLVIMMMMIVVVVAMTLIGTSLTDTQGCRR
jgi:hypothetical protein